MAEIVCVMEDEACLPAGTIMRLSDAQLSARPWQVRPLTGGWWIALVPLWFQLGEVITLIAPLEAAWAAPFTPPELRQPVMRYPNLHLRKIKALGVP